MVTVLAEVDSLPGAQPQSSIPDRDREAATQHRRFDVRGHVVGTFARMLVWKVLWSQRRKRAFQVVGYVWIGIFINRERGRGVLDEHVQQPNAQGGQLW